MLLEWHLLCCAEVIVRCCLFDIHRTVVVVQTIAWPITLFLYRRNDSDSVHCQLRTVFLANRVPLGKVSLKCGVAVWHQSGDLHDGRHISVRAMRWCEASLQLRTQSFASAKHNGHLHNVRRSYPASVKWCGLLWIFVFFGETSVSETSGFPFCVVTRFCEPQISPTIDRCAQRRNKISKWRKNYLGFSL